MHRIITTRGTLLASEPPLWYTSWCWEELRGRWEQCRHREGPMSRAPLHALIWSEEQRLYELYTRGQLKHRFRPAEEAAWLAWLGSGVLLCLPRQRRLAQCLPGAEATWGCVLVCLPYQRGPHPQALSRTNGKPQALAVRGDGAARSCTRSSLRPRPSRG